ncbi:hypothetical protein AVEN_235429-1 [Araneus ventricosus]|uniref:Uncharacterized protein n=1 Tax=Araneus ventricosus TaxID=182803 RepID=A0A4Y2A3Q7_ARAVE|nr:hypothetical protein AVEN_235429-1 [Araneus ventricosus]
MFHLAYDVAPFVCFTAFWAAHRPTVPEDEITFYTVPSFEISSFPTEGGILGLEHLRRHFRLIPLNTPLVLPSYTLLFTIYRRLGVSFMAFTDILRTNSRFIIRIVAFGGNIFFVSV